ncbi:MAG: ATP-binding protein [Chlamydiia bacterium]|nr:ATP-binding protein [Chlamydiia bacterium]
MIQELTHLHQELMASIVITYRRFLYELIHWESQAICIYGARGVGKTTLICQYFLEKYGRADRALYISGDNIHVISEGLLSIATHYFSMGGEALFIDEVHKYPNWSIEVKNIIDTYRTKQIIISGSSAMELHEGKGDLSRRVVYYELPGLSFREYLQFMEVKELPAVTLDEVLKDHVSLAGLFADQSILKHFNDYLRYGYYPYFLESRSVYLLKINNVIEKVITEDIPASKSVKPNTILVLKKLLWLVANSTCLVPNVDRISKDLNVTRDVVYNGFEYLEKAGLIRNVFPETSGMRLVRKPGKIYLENTNLLHAINGSLSLEGDAGSIRETFFANQLALRYSIHIHETADFTIDNRYTIEVGGKNKKEKQIKQEGEKGYLAVDNIQVGIGKRIPLYLFGLLY